MTQRAGATWLSALLLLWVPGCLALWGPSTVTGLSAVTGTEGGSLSVQCHYEEKFKAHNKYWCRRSFIPPCEKIVETKGSESEVRSGRVSIRDHPANLTFTVTVGNLTKDDRGRYWCGVGTSWFSGPDPALEIVVTVSPAATPTKTLPSTTLTTIPAVLSTTGATPSASNQDSPHHSQGTRFPPPHLPGTAHLPPTSAPRLPVLLSVLALLLLLLVGTSLLAWRMMKRPRKAGKNSEPPWNSTQAADQSEVCYANLELPTWPSLGEPVHPWGMEVEYCTVAAPREEPHYSLVAFEGQSLDSKANRSPSQRSREETEYSVVKKT
ncbi:CMRF35-like molecule 8 isoform X1 [Dasypus novemcinctus]|uniref:CMRF35-like molecule 8 isoform X1 n=1 Tax=Dasypus novemcinctus TaxID=9361 RepID=UPI00265E2A67|nr:CMRF35-like molecule 8 isoform X1 [Dasypus novemcinctus]XP_023443704.2 CMRF35-like molecule 8 isoform X1 [Dasypus novemcinctus]